MSRAMNVDAELTDVRAMCAKHKCGISAIEALLSGGTRVVLMNGDDAATIRRAYGRRVMTGPVTRTMWVRNR